MSGKNKKSAASSQGKLPKGNSKVQGDQVDCPLKKVDPPPPQLAVKVWEQGKSTAMVGATVTAVGPAPDQAQRTAVTNASGMAEFGDVPKGNYTISFTLGDPDAETFTPAKESWDVGVSDGLTTKGVAAEKFNVVTPKLEVEYKVVLLERDRGAQQTGDEKKITASPTRVELSFEETNPAHAYSKGAKFECTPANVDIFLDEDCEKPLVGDLTFEQLTDETPCKLYLRGKTAGKCKLKMTLLDPADAKVKLKDNPTTEIEIGVVKMEMKLHFQNESELAGLKVDPDTDPVGKYYTDLNSKVMPEQKLMSDEEKSGVPSETDAAKPGRLLHKQKDASFGRAKLICVKIDASHLPDETGDYEMVLKSGKGFALKTGPTDKTPGGFDGKPGDDPGSGAVEIFDAEFDGAKKTDVKVKLSVLSGADQTFWVEGTTGTDKVCDLRLYMGLDRAEGGLEKSVKANADWVRFTVVEIKEVKIAYKQPTGNANAWDDAEKRFYINLINGEAGRKVKISATLTKEFQNVRLYFMLAPDKDNLVVARWGQSIAGAGKWKYKDITGDVKSLDKADRQDVMHLFEATNDKGYAEKELRLSQYGGDKFQPAAYMAQDPHLAKYIHGDTNLEKRKPVFCDDTITVWRKFWYQKVIVPGVTQETPADAITEVERYAITGEACPDLNFPANRVAGVTPKAIYPKFQLGFSGDNSNGLVVGDDNVAQFFDAVTVEADKPIKIPFIICDIMLINDTDATKSSGWVAPTVFPATLDMGAKVVKPSLQNGNIVVSGNVEFAVPKSPPQTGHTVTSVPITEAMVTISTTRGMSRNQVQVSLPGGVPVGTTHARLVNLTVKSVQSFCGTYYTPGKYIAARVEPGSPIGMVKTLVHEVFHAFHQVARGTLPTGVPAHPHQYNKNGSHCNYPTSTCYMFESAIQGNAVCPVCVEYLRLADLSTLSG